MKSPITILYVDDEPINLMLFDVCFKKKYKVITAESGFVGLEKLEQNSDISFVFSDMKMPGMNGIEFITLAKQKFPKLSFYILTGFGLTEEIIKAMDDGLVLKCFFKPFDIEEIESVLDN